MLEGVVESRMIRLRRDFEEARSEVIGILKANKAGILAGFAYGAASRLFFNEPVGALPAMLTPLITYARKHSWGNKLDSAGVSEVGYFIGYALTGLVLTSVFNEFAQNLPPPVLPPQPPLQEPYEQPQLPRGIWV